MGLGSQRLRRIEREADRVLGAPETVPLRDGSTLKLGPDGRINCYLDLFDAHDRAAAAEGEDADPLPYAQHPLLIAIWADEVDFDFERPQELEDGSLAAFVHIIRCLHPEPFRGVDEEEG
jgi:hypothetical protein